MRMRPRGIIFIAVMGALLVQGAFYIIEKSNEPYCSSQASFCYVEDTTETAYVDSRRTVSCLQERLFASPTKTEPSEIKISSGEQVKIIADISWEGEDSVLWYYVMTENGEIGWLKADWLE